MSDELEKDLIMDGDEDYEADVIELDDEDGQTHKFEVIDATDIDNVRYFMLSPWGEDGEAEDDEDGSFLIMRLAKDDEGEFLEIVEDQDELQSAVQIFSSRLKDLFDIELD